jgi:hypothetical protein
LSTELRFLSACRVVAPFGSLIAGMSRPYRRTRRSGLSGTNMTVLKFHRFLGV